MSPADEAKAIEEIKQVKARYFRCMDTKDWAGQEEVFTPDAVVDSSEAFVCRDFTGALLSFDGVKSPEPDKAWIFHSAKDFIRDTSKVLTGVSTVHHGHMPEITLTSDTTAKGTWAMEDKLWWPKGSPMRHVHGYGHYQETYERTAKGWRIKTLKLTRIRVDVFKD